MLRAIRDNQRHRRPGSDFRALLAREEAEGIDPAVVEAERQAVRAAIARRDVARLREKGIFAARREQDSSGASRIEAVTTKVVESNGTHAPSPAQGHALWWPHQGHPNKATANAREAIARFVDGNSERLQGWLDEIAKEDGPKAAFACVVDLLEFHVPKLARTEMTGKAAKTCCPKVLTYKVEP